MVADYAAVYRNDRRQQLTPSRRLEAWYLGSVDFKLAKLCQGRIAELRKKGQNVQAEERELKEIIHEGFRAGGNMNAASTRLLRLAEKLLGY